SGGSRAPGRRAQRPRRRHPGQGLARHADGAHLGRALRRRAGTGRALMLYLLLVPYANKFALFNVFRYPSFRVAAAGLVSLLIGLLLGPHYIEALRKKQQGVSNVREDTPERHAEEKKTTPSMGGGLILWALLIGTLLFADLT